MATSEQHQVARDAVRSVEAEIGIRLAVHLVKATLDWIVANWELVKQWSWSNTIDRLRSWLKLWKDTHVGSSVVDD